MLSDLRLSVRALTKAPGFALVTILTLALGIGACTSLIGVGVGIGGAVRFAPFLTRVLPAFGGSMLLPVQAVAVGLVACWLPARRAAIVDPLVALRAE